MDFNEIKKTLKHEAYTSSMWIDYSILLGNISKQLINQDKNIEKNIVYSLSFLILISKVFDIDMNNAWDKWERKALKKHYFTTLYQ